jgi:hypothetical protein
VSNSQSAPRLLTIEDRNLRDRAHPTHTKCTGKAENQWALGFLSGQLIVGVTEATISEPLVKQRVDSSPLSYWIGVPDHDPFEHLLATIADATPLYELCARVLG